MINIKNAKIKNPRVAFDDRGRLAVTIYLDSHPMGCPFEFVLKSTSDVEMLIKIMTYTESNDLNELNGKVIRVVSSDCFLRGFGHPVENKFVSICGDIEELTLEAFERKLQ